MKGSLAPRFGIVLLGVILVSAYVLSQISDVELGEVAPYFLVAIALQVVPFAVRRQPDPFEPASLTAVMNMLAIVPALTAYVVNGGVNIALLPQITGRARVELLQTVMIGYSLGSISYYIGYYQGVGKRLAKSFPEVQSGPWKRSRVILVCAVCFAMFIPAYAYFQARVGTSLTNITELSAGKQVMKDDNSRTWVARAVGVGFIPPLVLLALAFPKWKWGKGLATVGLLVLVGFLAIRLGSRGTAIYTVINALIVVHYLWKRIPISVLAPLAFFVLVMMNLLGQYRTGGFEATASNPSPTANFDATATLVEHDDDRLRVAATAVVFDYFPDKKDYLMGESWGPALTAFIPRWLWPEKHLLFLWRDSNIILMICEAPVPVGYLALLYANFSWIGIVLGMAAWGAYQRGMYEWLVRSNGDRGVVLLYSCLVVYFGPTMLQLSATIGYVVPVWVVLRFLRTKIKAAKSEPAAAGSIPPRPASAPLLPAESAAGAE